MSAFVIWAPPVRTIAMATFGASAEPGVGAWPATSAIAPLSHVRALVFGLGAFYQNLATMAKLEEIVERVDRRLEELRDESTRLRAALEALGRDDASANRHPHAGRTARPAVKIVGRGYRVKPTSGAAVTLAAPNAVGGDDATPDPAVDRAIRQLRQELAAGLRG